MIQEIFTPKTIEIIAVCVVLIVWILAKDTNVFGKKQKDPEG